MHTPRPRFPHGIRQAFLRPVWAPFRRCLPLLALLQSCPEDGDDDELPTNKAQHDEGDLLPQSRGNEEGDLLPPASGENREEIEAECNLQPTIKGQDNDGEGPLLPSLGDELHATKPNLQAHNGGLKEDVGSLPPQRGTELQQADRALTNNGIPKIGASCSFNFAEFNAQIHDSAQLKIFFMKTMHTALGKPGYCHMVNAHGIINHAKPRVNPKVKKKTSLLLCITIQTPFHPGEQWQSCTFHGKHDVWVSPHPHHDLPHLWPLILFNGCSKTLLQNASTPNYDIFLIGEGRHLRPHTLSKEDHPLKLFTLLRGSCCNLRNVASLHNIYIDGKNANYTSPASPRLQAAADAGRFFLIPLRGRRCDQWNDEVENEDVATSKMKTKRKRKLMRLFYLTKDVLDPG